MNKAHCQFVDGKCSQCGEPITPRHIQYCIAGPMKHKAKRRKRKAAPLLPCVHLAGPAGDPIKIECDTCEGRKLKNYQAHRCELLGRCLPTYRPTEKQRAKWLERKPESDLYHLCQGCPSRTTPTPPAPAPAE